METFWKPSVFYHGSHYFPMLQSYIVHPGSLPLMLTIFPSCHPSDLARFLCVPFGFSMALLDSYDTLWFLYGFLGFFWYTLVSQWLRILYYSAICNPGLLMAFFKHWMIFFHTLWVLSWISYVTLWIPLISFLTSYVHLTVPFDSIMDFMNSFMTFYGF